MRGVILKVTQRKIEKRGREKEMRKRDTARGRGHLSWTLDIIMYGERLKTMGIDT